MRLFCATKIRDGTEKGPERSGSFLLCVEICPSFPAAHPECPWVADRLALGVDLWASSGRYFDAYSLSLLAEAIEIMSMHRSTSRMMPTNLRPKIGRAHV